MDRGAWQAPVYGGLTFCSKWTHTVHNIWGLVLFPLSVVLYRVIQVSVCPVLLLTSAPWQGCTTSCLTSRFSKDLVFFHFGGIFFFLSCYEHSYTGFWVSAVARLYRRYTFSILRKCLTVFQNACTIPCKHQHCISDPGFPYPCKHLVLLLFFILAYSDR